MTCHPDDMKPVRRNRLFWSGPEPGSLCTHAKSLDFIETIRMYAKQG